MAPSPRAARPVSRHPAHVAAVGVAALAAATLLAGCGTEKAAEKPQVEVKKEPPPPAGPPEAFTVARKVRALDGILGRADKAAKEAWLAKEAPDATRPVDKFLQAYAQEDRRVAWKSLDTLRREDPKSPLGYLGILCVYAEWKLVDEAQKAYDQAILLDPKMAWS